MFYQRQNWPPCKFDKQIFLMNFLATVFYYNDKKIFKNRCLLFNKEYIEEQILVFCIQTRISNFPI